MSTDDDRLRIDDFVPAAGGEWHGLLFDNQSLALPPSLTWAFTFPFEDVSGEDESMPLALHVEWLPVPADSWRRVAGQRVTSPAFGEPAEASVYHYTHHRFETVDVEFVEQRGHSLRAVVDIAGDIDGLGVEPIRADAWLTFTGVLVSLDDVTDADAALARLGHFTDTTGLTLDRSATTDAALRFIAQPATSAPPGIPGA